MTNEHATVHYLVDTAVVCTYWSVTSARDRISAFFILRGIIIGTGTSYLYMHLKYEAWQCSFYKNGVLKG